MLLWLPHIHSLNLCGYKNIIDVAHVVETEWVPLRDYVRIIDMPARYHKFELLTSSNHDVRLKTLVVRTINARHVDVPRVERRELTEYADLSSRCQVHLRRRVAYVLVLQV